MAPVVQIKRTLNPNSPPGALAEGELSVELGGPIRLWVGLPSDPNGKILLVDSSVGTIDAYTKTEATARFVDVVGDTMAGNLTINNVAGSSRLTIGKVASGNASEIRGNVGAAARWNVALGDGTAESSANVGSNFGITRYMDNGNSYPALLIGRATGNANIYGNVVTIDGSGAGGTGAAALILNKVSGSCDLRSTLNSNNQWLVQVGDATGDFAVTRFPSGVAATAYWIQQSDGALYYQSGSTYKPGGGEWAASSDARIKTVVADYDSGLSEIKQLQPVRYTYKGNETTKQSAAAPPPTAKEFIGLVAQDVEGPMPEMVESVEGFIDDKLVVDLRMLDASALKYALVNAVKELASRVESLEAQLAVARK